MKKIVGMLLAIVLVGTMGMSVNAAQVETSILENTNKPFIALGADLSLEQQATVLSLMGLTEEDLPNYTVIYVTNEMEHQYLDEYVASDIIGTKSLSSVLVKQAEEGHGVIVTTKNISYCTTGMYRNALLTAGVENADIMVVGPSQISGTAGLIGALKAYEAMSGTVIAETTIDTAMNELVTTGEIAGDSLYSDEIEELVAYIKGKIAAGELETDEDIKNAIIEAQDKYGVTLSEEEITKIVDLMKKIDQLGIDPALLLDQAQDIYKKYGEELLNNTDKAVDEIIKDTVSDFFTNIGNSIVGFFKNLFFS